MKNFIIKTVNIVFTILIGFITLTTITYLSGLFSDTLGGTLRLGTSVTLVMFVFFFLFFGKTLIDIFQNKLGKYIKNLNTKQMIIIIALVSLISKVFLTFLLGNDVTKHEDMHMYLSFAEQIATNGKITEYTTYATQHSYTAIFGLLLSPFVKLFGSSSQALLIVLAVATTITHILVFDIVRKYTGNPIAFVGIVIYNLTPMGLFQTQALLHETGLLFLHALSFWLFLKYFEDKYKLLLRLLFLVISAVLIAIGKAVNPSGIIIIVSMCIFTVAKISADKLTVKRLGKILSTVAIIVVCLVTTTQTLVVVRNNIIEDYTTVKSSLGHGVKYGWGLYLGANYEKSGRWNQEDKTTYYAFREIQDEEEAHNYQINLITERYEELLSSPVKLPTHIYKKLEVLWGAPPLTLIYRYGNIISLYLSDNFVYECIRIISSLISMSVYSMTFFSAIKFKKSDKKSDNNQVVSAITHFKMVIIGITLALLPFEVATKYTAHLHILMYAIWMMEIRNFRNNSETFNSKIKGFFHKKTKKAKLANAS